MNTVGTLIKRGLNFGILPLVLLAGTVGLRADE